MLLLISKSMKLSYRFTLFWSIRTLQSFQIVGLAIHLIVTADINQNDVTILNQ
jgi:hypothetical protein